MDSLTPKFIFYTLKSTVILFRPQYCLLYTSALNVVKMAAQQKVESTVRENLCLAHGELDREGFNMTQVSNAGNKAFWLRVWQKPVHLLIAFFCCCMAGFELFNMIISKIEGKHIENLFANITKKFIE